MTGAPIAIAPWAAAALALLAGALALALSRVVSNLRDEQRKKVSAAGFSSVRLPPVVPGLPLLGSALALGRGGAAFLQQCHEQVGRGMLHPFERLT